MSFTMWFSLSPARVGWRFMEAFITWPVCWSGLWSAAVSRMNWWAPVWRWFVMWGITVGMIYFRVMVSRNTHVMVSVVSWVASGGITVTVSVRTGLGSWSAVLISILVMVVWNVTWYGILFYDSGQAYLKVVFDVGSPLLYVHIHHNQNIIHVNMAWLLTLEASIFFIWHGIYWWWW